MCDETKLSGIGEGFRGEVQRDTPLETDEARFVPPSHDRLMPWLAALGSASVPCYVDGAGVGVPEIVVPRSMADAAMRELREYETVNQDWPPSLGEGEVIGGGVSGAALLVWGFMAAYILRLHVWTGAFSPHSRIFSIGGFDVDAFRSGEWWRAATALSLHADFVHALSNAFWGMFFGVWASARVGAGAALGLTILCGVLGNATEGFISSGGRTAIGASTATFATVGLLCAFRFCENYRYFGKSISIWSRTWLPLVAGLGMLAFLGSGGTSAGNVDLVGHASGFLWGLGVGVGFSTIVRERLRTEFQVCCGVGAVGGMALAWYWGLSASG